MIAALWPFSVNGLLVLASLRLLEVGAGTRRRVRCTVWAAFGLGVVVSLVANIAAAPALTWQSILVAGWRAAGRSHPAAAPIYHSPDIDDAGSDLRAGHDVTAPARRPLIRTRLTDIVNTRLVQIRLVIMEALLDGWYQPPEVAFTAAATTPNHNRPAAARPVGPALAGRSPGE